MNICKYFCYQNYLPVWCSSTHWGRVMHICVSKLSIIGLNNGVSSDRCQAIIWTNAEILLIRPLGRNFSEFLIEIHIFAFKKMHLKMRSGKWQPSCLSLDLLKSRPYYLRVSTLRLGNIWWYSPCEVKQKYTQFQHFIIIIKWRFLSIYCVSINIMKRKIR